MITEIATLIHSYKISLSNLQKSQQSFTKHKFDIFVLAILQGILYFDLISLNQKTREAIPNSEVDRQVNPIFKFHSDHVFRAMTLL